MDIASIASLVNVVVSLYSRLEASRQSALDRESQRELQEARLRHDAMINARKSEPTRHGANNSQLPARLMDRLNHEAMSLSQLGFHVIFEPVGAGLGLGLPVGGNCVCFWIPPDYPMDPFDVYLIVDNRIDKVSFAGDAWKPSVTMTEVVLAIMTGIKIDPEWRLGNVRLRELN